MQFIAPLIICLKYGAAEGELREAVYSYNHSEKYVEDVLYYAEFYKAEFEEKH